MSRALFTDAKIGTAAFLAALLWAQPLCALACAEAPAALAAEAPDHACHESEPASSETTAPVSGSHECRCDVAAEALPSAVDAATPSLAEVQIQLALVQPAVDRRGDRASRARGVVHPPPRDILLRKASLLL